MQSGTGIVSIKAMHFAARTSFDPEPTAYSAALSAARSRGPVLDLTVSNPTRCGFDFPAAVVEALSHPAVLQYDPDPAGMRTARDAVSAMYAERHGAQISTEDILLTASTSESYSYLLRLFCEPGDAVLVPFPSYPLFDLLGALHDVELRPYTLLRHDGWRVDINSLRAAVTPRTRALVVIHPNNPTGHFCSEEDRDYLLAFAREHELPLIVDEVFLEYGLEGNAPSFLVKRSALEPASGGEKVLTVVLGGISKLLCLPQMKLGWMALQGPRDLVTTARSRLEIIADTFLSVGTLPQIALPTWLRQQRPIAAQVQERTLGNLAHLDRVLPGTAVSRLRVEAGWTVVLRVPSLGSDEALAVQLLEQYGVALHPGSLYGFGGGWLVCSLLPRPEEFRRGIASLLTFFAL